MIDALFSQPDYLAAKKMLDVTALRQEAISSNLANLETPNYKRLDVNPAFSTELQRAMASQDPQKIANLQPTVAVDAMATAENRDGNTVQMESELVNLNQNSFAHALESQLVTSTYLQLKTAITGVA